MIQQAPQQDERRRVSRLLELGQMTMLSEREGDVHTIAVAGELDVAGAGRVEQELQRVESTDVVSIVVDLSGLTFVESTGVRLLIEAQARSRADSGRLMLLRGPEDVQRVFELCGVEDRLPFAD
jgi:anti-sigma B factor antagonist